jgi:hypothetical protein
MESFMEAAKAQNWAVEPQESNPFHRKLGWTQSLFCGSEVENNLLSLPGIEPRPSSLYTITALSELSRLLDMHIIS